MGILYTNCNGSQGISEDEREAFKKALTHYYSEGGRIADVFNDVEPGLIDRYYRRRKKFPEEIRAIDAAARAAAALEVSAQQVAFQAEQVRASIQLRRQATEALKEISEEMARIAKGQPRCYRDDETGETKIIYVYPRDSIQAAKFVRDMARDGIMPKGYQHRYSGEKKEAARQPFIPPLHGIGPDLKSVSVETPDGKTFTATVDDGPIFVESENGKQRVGDDLSQLGMVTQFR